jgi:hypothetical protein
MEVKLSSLFAHLPLGISNATVDLARQMDKCVVTGASGSGLRIDQENQRVYDRDGNTCIVKGQVRTTLLLYFMKSGDYTRWIHWSNFKW